MGKDTVVIVQPREPTVAEATEDRPPPIRASMDIVQRNPVVINSREYQVLAGKEDGETHVPAYSARHNEFSERDLPVVPVSDTTCISEKQQRQILPTIASVSEPVAIKSAAEDVPNQVADPEAVGREAKEKARRNRNERPALEEMRDPGVLDLLTRLLNRSDRETFHFGQRALDLIQYGGDGGKQCGGGNGGKSSQTESSTNQGGQGGFVTGYTGRSSLVVGGFVGGSGGGLGGAGGGDDDPNNYNPFNGPPGHYVDFMGFEEQPNSQNDQDRNAAMATVLSVQGPMINPMNPVLPQFNDTHEEPLSASLEGSRLLDSDPMLMDFEPFYDPSMNDAQYLCNQDPMFQVAPAEETASGVMQPVPQPVSDDFPTAEESDIKQSFDLIHLMKPQAQRSRPPQGQIIGITPSGGASIPRSQIQGLNLLAPVPSPAPTPSPAPSTASSTGFPPTPSPLPPPTPATPSTPATPQPRGFFIPKTYTDENSRVCELSISPEIPPEKRNTAIQAMLYINNFYASAFQCAESEMDLKVASDVHAKMCPMHMDWDACSLKVALSMPKECKPLNRWLKTNTNPKDHMLILQQVLNTLATIHTLGYEDNLSLWGSFMVWVASDLRVHILVDIPRLLQTQQEYEMCGERHMNPRSLDVAAVKEVYSKVVQPCIGRDGSWVSPALRNVLISFECFLSDPRSSCKMAEAARMLGEKRVCKVDVDMGLSVVFYCLEREELQTALRDLSRLAPRNIAQVWTLRSSDGSFMRVGDIATADRPMKLTLEPCMHPKDTRLLYIMCN